MLVFAKQKTEFLKAALELAKDNPLDAGYIKAKADAEKMFKKECAKLRKKEKEALGKALSAKCQEVDDMGLPDEQYEKICMFDSHKEGQDALWDKGGWITSKSGRRGSNKSQSYHGGEKGKYKLTCDKNGEGWAYLWAATSNATSLTIDDLDGAKELEEEDEDEEDEVLTDQLLDELDAVIVSGGKTVNEIKAMHVLEKKKHAEVCNKNRSISAQSVNELATKMGCPSDYTTKLSKLGWIFLQLQA